MDAFVDVENYFGVGVGGEVVLGFLESNKLCHWSINVNLVSDWSRVTWIAAMIPA